MTGEIIPFNPLDKGNLGKSVANALLASPVHPLGELPVFSGAGIYAIYYTGDFPAYARLAEGNRDGKFAIPIYVGKAIPAGGRKGGGESYNVGRPLQNRLSEHADSIKAASNLNVEDFHCRFLVVDDIWIPLGEHLVIARFSPLWNTFLDGFGNHDPGKGRYKGMRPKWDVLHPGRQWALRCAERDDSQDDIIREVSAWLASMNFV